MGKVTTEELVKLHARGKEYIKALQAGTTKLKKRIQKAYKELEDRTQLEDLLRKIDCVVDGVPLSIRTMSGEFIDIYVVNDYHSRSAEVYLNQHNKKTWGIKIYHYENNYGRKERWLGADWPNKDCAMEIATQWVVHGTTPQRKVNPGL